MIRKIGFLLIAAAFLIFISVVYINSKYSQVTQEFSPYTILASSWEKYKQAYITDDGRVIDPSNGGITTSEGQSYAMLRAIWIDDKETFDKVWKFTRENLKRPQDALFGWRWGKKKDNSYGFVIPEDRNNASDADSDIALALILASRRWGNKDGYFEAAKLILRDLWRLNTATAAGRRYLIAGNWAKNGSELIINPSYFAPYAWRIFATADPARDWNSLITPSYDLLQRASEDKLDKEKSVGLPPDWVAVDTKTGAIRAVNNPALTTNYSFDAQRVPWRIAIDYVWNKEPKAKEYLTKLSFLKDTYTANGKLEGAYTHDGKPMHKESPINYATALGYFLVTEKPLAKKIYEEKILGVYSNDQTSFNKDLSYYEQNLLWFGTALYHNIINPYEKKS